MDILDDNLLKCLVLFIDSLIIKFYHIYLIYLEQYIKKI